MAYRLDDGEAVPNGVRRIASEELDNAIEALEVAPQKRADGVHDARKNFKKVRALLRLISGEFDSNRLGREDAAIRDAGRALASTRDAEVVVQALDSLKRRFGAELDSTAFDGVRRSLMRERRSARKKLEASNALVDEVASTLGDARSRVDSWPVDRDSFGALRGGLRRTYAQGRKVRRRVCDDPTTENFHSWRKQVKTLWYSIRLVERLWPPVLRRYGEQLEELADALGEDHDLAVLRAVVHERPMEGAEALVALLDQRRAELQIEALHLGALLYAERPRAFVRRLKRYWEASRAKRRLDAKDVSDWRALATSADAAP